MVWGIMLALMLLLEILKRKIAVYAIVDLVPVHEYAPIVSEIERAKRKERAPMVHKDNPCDLAGDTLTLIIVAYLVFIHTERYAVLVYAERSEQRGNAEYLYLLKPLRLSINKSAHASSLQIGGGRRGDIRHFIRLHDDASTKRYELLGSGIPLLKQFRKFGR